MTLLPRQLETIENIKIKGIITSEDIISYCEKKLTRPRNRKAPLARRHSKKYYQEIINYYSSKD